MCNWKLIGVFFILLRKKTLDDYFIPFCFNGMIDEDFDFENEMRDKIVYKDTWTSPALFLFRGLRDGQRSIYNQPYTTY
jgi:hypothetical protein